MLMMLEVVAFGLARFSEKNTFIFQFNCVNELLSDEFGRLFRDIDRGRLKPPGDSCCCSARANDVAVMCER